MVARAGDQRHAARDGSVACAAKAAGGVATEAITLDTSAARKVTQTITVAPTDFNAGGFSQVLTAQTLTVTGTVEPLPPPVITVSGTLAGLVDVPEQLGTLNIADPNTDTLRQILRYQIYRAR